MGIDILLLATSVAFFIWSIRSLSHFAIIFQRLPYIFETKSFFGKTSYLASTFFSLSSLFSWVLLIVSFYITITDLSTFYVELLITVLFIGKLLVVVSEIKNDKLHTNQLYPRSIVLVVMAFLFVALLSFYPFTIHIIWFLILDRALFLIAMVFLFLFGFPTEILDDLSTRKATHHTKSLRSVRKILIIGSDSRFSSGFVKQIVSEKHKVKEIDVNKFSRGELAKKLLRLSPNDDIVILYVNPRSRNLTKLALTMLNADYCIILNDAREKDSDVININYLSQFIPARTKLILPTTYKKPWKLYLKKHMTYFYSPVSEKAEPASVSVEDVAYKKNGIKFSLVLSSNTLPIDTNLIDIDAIDLLLAPIILAIQLGLTFRDIQKTVDQILTPKEFLSLRKTKSMVVIDGTGITTTGKAINQINYLMHLKKRVTIIMGTLDQTEDFKDLMRFGTAINTVTKQLVLVKPKYLRALRSTLKDKIGNTKVTITDKSYVAKMLKTQSSIDVVLFLGSGIEDLLENSMN